MISPVVVNVLLQLFGFTVGFLGMAVLAALAAGLCGYLLWVGVGPHRRAQGPLEK
ncbi:MAG: hypothetical protein H7338_01840 [Candidatus Sericytochromatia bacterium]|nr:hypothetical protein [Candidatus Sericytochromatia bacterium]